MDTCPDKCRVSARPRTGRAASFNFAALCKGRILKSGKARSLRVIRVMERTRLLQSRPGQQGDEDARCPPGPRGPGAREAAKGGDFARAANPANRPSPHPSARSEKSRETPLGTKQKSQHRPQRFAGRERQESCLDGCWGEEPSQSDSQHRGENPYVS